jgi:hypoxanthine phosphoribosyltransferase
MDLHSRIERVLWGQDQIARRVAELASEISADFGAGDSAHPPRPPPVLVGVATGAFLFLADLVRTIDLPISVDFVRAQSYGSGTLSSGAPELSLDLKVDVKGKHVILVVLLVLILRLHEYYFHCFFYSGTVCYQPLFYSSFFFFFFFGL